MICKNCKREIPDNSIFCNWCGTQQIKKKKQPLGERSITVPKPTQLPSGKWNVYLRAEGESITANTYAECEAKAIAVRAGFIEKQKALPKITLEKACNKYIKERSDVLSPSTIHGYECIVRSRFQSSMPMDINKINWQRMINLEATLCSPKTLKNSWGFISSVLANVGLEKPSVTLPQVPHKELAWLDYTQIQSFLKAVNGKSVELAALLALHGLRKSELLMVTKEKIVDNRIIVEGAKVRGHKGWVEKDTNKNDSSARVVPIMIPRLEELIEQAPCGKLVTMYPDRIYISINEICEKAKLPKVGIHGLRRSFASLCYHLKLSEMETMRLGGWKDYKTMRAIYTKLSEKEYNAACQKLRDFYTYDLQTS